MSRAINVEDFSGVTCGSCRSCGHCRNRGFIVCSSCDGEEHRRCYMQVKSSDYYAGKYERKTERRGRVYRIHVVVVRPNMDPAVVLGRVLAACIVAREEALAAGCVADDRRLYELRQEAA